GLVATVAYRLGDAPARYALEGSIAISGALVQWLRDNLGVISSSAEVEALAASVEDNGDVYIVPAFSGLYAPYWKDHARGVIAGLTRYATRAHIARAALEATAYQTRDVLDAMERDSGVKLAELRVDGGMVVNELLMQFQADILDARVVRPQVTETTALGAAYAAGLATGYWKGVEDLKRNWRVARSWTPDMPGGQRERLCAGWRKAGARWLGGVGERRSPLRLVARLENPTDRRGTPGHEDQRHAGAQTHADVRHVIEAPAEAVDQVHHGVEERDLLPQLRKHADRVEAAAQESKRRDDHDGNDLQLLPPGGPHADDEAEQTECEGCQHEERDHPQRMLDAEGHEHTGGCKDDESEQHRFGGGGADVAGYGFDERHRRGQHLVDQIGRAHV